MTGWNTGNSIEERAAEVAVGLLAGLFAIGVVVWAAGELGGLLSHGAWPPVSVGDAPGVAVGLLQHPADPASGWPSQARRTAPPPWLYYGLLVVLLAMFVTTGLAIARRAFGTSAEHRAARRVPPGLSRPTGLRRYQRPFLGWASIGPFPRLLMASAEDCVAVIGPHGSARRRAC